MGSPSSETGAGSQAVADRPRWTHARSYVGLAPPSYVHRARLARLRSLLQRLDLPERGLIIDLGSEGYVLSEMQRTGDLPRAWGLAGYDCKPRLLKAARRRALAGARFQRLNLNDATASVVVPADVVLCLETLEHVGDYRSALCVIHAAMNPGGLLVLSMPNEVGVVGLVKLLGRPLVRRHAYRGFFTGRRDLVRYAIAVASHQDLEPFRSPPRDRWAPHLGFDHRQVMRHIEREFLDRGLWRVEGTARSALGANRFLVARRES
jgi:2-polyprenyl-3-methyl-5-hydroxy-6-metoxy-1,4-benzoquinol methylase